MSNRGARGEVAGPAPQFETTHVLSCPCLTRSAPTTGSCAEMLDMSISGPLPPESRLLSLFDHLIGAQHYRWRYGKAERLGGLEVQHHFVFHRKLHREIARLLAA
jgi:hypothetical protein